MVKEKFYTPQEIKKIVADKKWVMAYNKLDAIYDNKSKKVMYIENYGPKDGFFVEGWRALHFPLTSNIVEKSYREGNITVFILREGKSKLNLVPSFAPIGIESCKVRSKEVYITIAGIGGGGVSASFSRGMTLGVKRVSVINRGGGKKLGKATLVLPLKYMLLIGVDDTDNETEGATYSLVHNIAREAAEKFKAEYVLHGNVQLYPYNPHKTKNCFSTVVGLLFSNKKQKRNIVEHFKTELKNNTFSKETGMAVYDGFIFSKPFIEFCKSLKFRILDSPKEIIAAANKEGVETYTITGKRGLIGAIAALPFFDNPDFAVKLPGQCR